MVLRSHPDENNGLDTKLDLMLEQLRETTRLLQEVIREREELRDDGGS